ncbi:MAG: hypothetical protein K6G01_03255 [Eubacterium sp.]|nr:hypothetical protein [Eubacterium sp.]
MSDIMNVAGSNISPSPAVNTTTQADEAKIPARNSQETTSEDIKKKTLDPQNVVSISSNGDTVQVSQEGNERSDVRLVSTGSQQSLNKPSLEEASSASIATAGDYAANGLTDETMEQMIGEQIRTQEMQNYNT